MERKRVVMAIIVVIILIGVLFFNDPSITGYVPTTTYSENVDIDVVKSQELYIQSKDGLPMSITSLLLTGEVTGEGLVNVYLKDPREHKLLVFSNKEKKGSALETITGMAVHEINVIPGKTINKIETVSERYNKIPGKFINQCKETCSLDPKIFVSNQFVLEVIIEPGTTLHILGIKFSLEEDL